MDILIDERIRDWVFFPILYVMFMVWMCRLLITKYLNNMKGIEKVGTQNALQDKQDKVVLAKCQRLQQNCSLLSEASFQMRRAYFCKESEGVLYKYDKAEPNPMAAASNMMNPGNMTDMLKNNITMAVTSIGQFTWINYFFSGFILGKVPFPLTQKFRGMLQKGVEVNIDVKYISSISLYFLVLFGVSSLSCLIFRGDDNDDIHRNASEASQINNSMMGGPGGRPGMGGPGMMGQAPDPNKMFSTERENFKLVAHSFKLENSEKLLLKKLEAEGK